MQISFLMRMNVIGDDIKCIIVRYTVGKTLLGPSVIYDGKGRYPAAIGVIRTGFVRFGACCAVLIGDKESMFCKTTSLWSVLVGTVCCCKLCKERVQRCERSVTIRAGIESDNSSPSWNTCI